MCSFDEVGAMARATVGSEAATGWGGVRSSSGGGGFGGGEANLDAEGTNREGLVEGSLLKRETTQEENERHTIGGGGPKQRGGWHRRVGEALELGSVAEGKLWSCGVGQMAARGECLLAQERYGSKDFLELSELKYRRNLLIL
jgi:hypothetical protein